MSQSKRGNALALSKSKQSSRNHGHTSVRSNLMSSDSRKSTQGGTIPSDKSSLIRSTIHVFDDAGNDVTPLPLLQSDPTHPRIPTGHVLADSTVNSPTDLMSQLSASFMTTSVFGGGPFSRSVFSYSCDTSESMPEGEAGSDLLAWADLHQRHSEEEDIPRESDLDNIVTITLEETETVCLLDIPTVSVSTNSEKANAVSQSNEKYKTLCKSRIGNDVYAERGMNTFNEDDRLKAVQTIKVNYSAIGVCCTDWDMYDTYKALEKDLNGDNGDEDEGTISRPNSPKTSGGLDPSDSVRNHRVMTSADIVTPLSQLTASTKADSHVDSRTTTSSSVAGSELFANKVTPVPSTTSDMPSTDEDKIMKSDALRRLLFILERVANLNTYQAKQAVYRGLKDCTDFYKDTSDQNETAVGDMGPNLERLWSYGCSLTKEHNVSCLAWNKSNPDLIAVGYGEFNFASQKSGLVCCWSLKNPEYPERLYTSAEGVTALDFSITHSNMLAVGYYDGGVAIFDVRRSTNVPILDNQATHGKHLGPVWQIKWINKEKGSGEEIAEVLITISTDGRVSQWSIRKGFECYDIMRLKKLPTRMAGKAKEKKGEAFISRHAGGLCFDFHPADCSVYLAGTEEGYIHKCSCSYNEQYLETYVAHTAHVYRIRWSPFVSDVFLSCSADWTICLWRQDRSVPILTFHSSTKAVHDICWSPQSSTVFACVNEGAVEVWDLTLSILDPVITVTPTSDVRLTSVTFGLNTECILVGDSVGQVIVYRLRSMPVSPATENQTETLSKLIDTTLATQLPGVTDSKQTSLL